MGVYYDKVVKFYYRQRRVRRVTLGAGAYISSARLVVPVGGAVQIHEPGMVSPRRGNGMSLDHTAGRGYN